MKRYRVVAAVAASAAALGVSGLVADSGVAAATTGVTTTDWNLAAISPATGATVKGGLPTFKWRVPQVDDGSYVYIIGALKQDTKTLSSGKLVATKNYGEFLGDSLSWHRTSYRYAAGGSTPLLAGTYVWQIQATNSSTNQPDYMPVQSFKVPAWIKLGKVHEETEYPSTGPAIVAFVGNLTGNVNDVNSMGRHPSDPRAQFVCDGTVVVKSGSRVVFTGKAKQDCSSATVTWGQLVFGWRATKIRASAGAHLSARVTVSGDGVTVKSNTFGFTQP